MSIKARLSRLLSLDFIPPPLPSYRVVLTTEDGQQWWRRPEIADPYLCAEWEPPWRRFVPGVDDADPDMVIHFIEAEVLADVEVYFGDHGPIVSDGENRDQRYPLGDGDETVTVDGRPLCMD